MNSQKTALALNEKGGCVVTAIRAAWRVEGSQNEKAVDLQFPCVCLSRLLSHQGTGCGGGQDHIHHYQWTLWRNRKCCRDAQNILRKRLRKLNQISEGSRMSCAKGKGGGVGGGSGSRGGEGGGPSRFRLENEGQGSIPSDMTRRSPGDGEGDSRRWRGRRGGGVAVDVAVASPDAGEDVVAVAPRREAW